VREPSEAYNPRFLGWPDRILPRYNRANDPASHIAEVICMSRKLFDCRNLPGECTLAISGEEEEVVRAQLLHAVEAHGVEDTPEMRKWIRSNLKDATD